MEPLIILRPRLRNIEPDVSLLAVWVAIVIALTIIFWKPSQLPAAIALVVIPIAVEVYGVRRIRLTVASDEIRVVAFMAPGGAAPRSSVSALHIFSIYLVFADSTGRTVLRTRPYWTKDQLLDLADLLSVPLFDHRQWLSLRDKKHGTRVTRAVSGSHSPGTE